eukprot:12895935-Prorocentrum_lima.AAC.1
MRGAFVGAILTGGRRAIVRDRVLSRCGGVLAAAVLVHASAVVFVRSAALAVVVFWLALRL